MVGDSLFSVNLKQQDNCQFKAESTQIQGTNSGKCLLCRHIVMSQMGDMYGDAHHFREQIFFCSVSVVG